MFEITYLEDYGKKVTRQYESEDIFIQAMNEMWPPFQDHFKVISFTKEGKDLGFNGQMGDLYYAFLKIKTH